MGSFFHQAMNKIDTQVHFHAAIRRFTNDPSAGSPTETLFFYFHQRQRFHPSGQTLGLHTSPRTNLHVRVSISAIKSFPTSPLSRDMRGDGFSLRAHRVDVPIDPRSAFQVYLGPKGQRCGLYSEKNLKNSLPL